jgi:hypothetical protein
MKSQGFDDAGKSEVGRLARNALQYAEAGNVRTDGAAIRIKQGGIIRATIPDLVPHGIFGEQGNLVPTGSAGRAKLGSTLCYSGVTLDGVSCGEVKREVMAKFGDVRLGVFNVNFAKRVRDGDSGAPVWNPHTGAAVGVVSGYYNGTQTSAVTPLLHPKGLNLGRVPGILHHSDMFDINLITGD